MYCKALQIEHGSEEICCEMIDDEKQSIGRRSRGSGWLAGGWKITRDNGLLLYIPMNIKTYSFTVLRHATFLLVVALQIPSRNFPMSPDQ
jgi:hypothetical protein